MTTIGLLLVIVAVGVSLLLFPLGPLIIGPALIVAGLTARRTGDPGNRAIGNAAIAAGITEVLLVLFLFLFLLP